MLFWLLDPILTIISWIIPVIIYCLTPTSHSSTTLCLLQQGPLHVTVAVLMTFSIMFTAIFTSACHYWCIFCCFWSVQASYLSPAMVRRLRCIIVVPLFLMSCFSVFYFFSGMAFGTVFLQRLIIQGGVFYFLVYTAFDFFLRIFLHV